MKKLLLILLAVSFLITSCGKGGDAETTVPESNAKVTDEAPKNEIPDSIIKFPTTNEKWSLTYDTKSDDNTLVLSNGTAEYSYAPYGPDAHNINYDIYPDIKSEEDARLVVSDDEKYAVIIYNAAIFDTEVSIYGHVPTDKAEIIDLHNGYIIENIIMTPGAFSNNKSYNELESYDNKDNPVYEIRMTAEFIKNTVEIHGKLTTFDGKLAMTATEVYEYTETTAINTPDGYKATMICASYAQKYDDSLGKYWYVDDPESPDQYYIYFAIPSMWKPYDSKITSPTREYMKYNDTPDYKGYSRNFNVFGLCEINDVFGFDENIHGYFYEGQPLPDHDPQEVWYPPTSPLEDYVKANEVHSGVTAKGYDYVAYGEKDEPKYVYIKIDEKYFVYFEFVHDGTLENKNLISYILDTICATTDPEWTEPHLK